MRVHSSLLPVTLLLIGGCAESEQPKEEAPNLVEGQSPGDCTDAADNDADGAFDCADDGCAESPDCVGGDENAAPSGAAIAIEPAAPVDADELSCVIVTEATDPNGDAVTYRYAWSVNGADAGVTSSSVSAALTTGGDTWTCTVTPTDGTLEGTAASASATIAVGNQAPSAPTVSITPEEPTDDDVLTCVIETESVDPDGDTVSYSYAWSVDGVDAGLSSASVNASLTEVGQQWTCAVAASDGVLASSSASASVEIGGCYVLGFDGMSGTTATLTAPSRLVGTGSFHAEAWVYLNSDASRSYGIMKIASAHSAYGEHTDMRVDGDDMDDRATQNGLALDPSYYASPNNGFTTIAVDSGSWVFLFYSWDVSSGVYRIGTVRDGVIEVETIYGPNRDQAAPVTIGIGYTEYGVLDGNVAVSRWYDSVPTDAEILAHADPDYSRSGASGLVLDFDFRRGSLVDAAGTGISVTLGGGAALAHGVCP